MKELELKYIAPHLPYDVKIWTEEELHFGENEYERHTIMLDNLSIRHVASGIDKLILNPLSNLTKEIEVNGKKFIPNEVLKQNAVTKYWWQSINTKGISPNADFNLILLLFEWHFDVFGLIEKGFAINKNNL